jgi:hypothetical protein
MKGFVRFTEVDGDRFSALINPHYDAPTLVRRHFERRYADQRRVIFDTAMVRRGFNAG